MKLVKYHNDFNKIKLGKFSSKELNILFTIFFALKDKGDEEVSFDFSEFKDLANLDRGNKNLFENIDSFSDKVITLRQTFETDDEKIKMNLFRTIKINTKNNKVKFAINKEFQYILNDLIGNYTKFDLKHMVELNSKYSKQTFKMLKQFDCPDKKNWFLIIVDDFKEKIGISNLYDRIDFAKIIKTILKELNPYFKNLKLIKLNSKKELVRRGQKTKYLKFVWDGDEFKKNYIEYTEPIKKNQSIEKSYQEKLADEHLKKMEEAKKKATVSDNSKANFKKGLINSYFETNNVKNGYLNEKDIDKINSMLKMFNFDKIEYVLMETGISILI